MRKVLAGRGVLFCFAVVLATLLFVSSCTPHEATAPPRLRVGYIPIIDCLPLYVAVEKGFFAEQGLQVELTPLRGGPMILEALGNGSLDIGFSNVVTLLTARSKGLQFQTVGGAVLETDASRVHGLLARSDSAIRSVSDLKGKRIAINARHNIDHFVMNRYLEMHRLPYDAVNYYEVPHAQMEPLLVKGEVDATISVEPYLTSALANKKVRLLDYEYVKAFPTLLVASYIARQDWLEMHSGEVEAFRSAMARAREFIAQNQSQARAFLPKYTRVNQDIAARVRLPIFSDDIPAQQLEMISRELLHQQFIDRPVAAMEVVYGKHQ